MASEPVFEANRDIFHGTIEKFMSKDPILVHAYETYEDLNIYMKNHMQVTGDEKSEIYQFLCADLEQPTWNFTKYLVGRDGEVLHRFAPRTEPDDDELRAKIAQALAD